MKYMENDELKIKTCTHHYIIITYQGLFLQYKNICKSIMFVPLLNERELPSFVLSFTFFLSHEFQNTFQLFVIEKIQTFRINLHKNGPLFLNQATIGKISIH